jgi:hypothetical protein
MKPFWFYGVILALGLGAGWACQAWQGRQAPGEVWLSVREHGGECLVQGGRRLYLPFTPGSAVWVRWQSDRSEDSVDPGFFGAQAWKDLQVSDPQGKLLFQDNLASGRLPSWLAVYRGRWRSTAQGLQCREEGEVGIARPVAVPFDLGLDFFRGQYGHLKLLSLDGRTLVSIELFPRRNTFCAEIDGGLRFAAPAPDSLAWERLSAGREAGRLALLVAALAARTAALFGAAGLLAWLAQRLLGPQVLGRKISLQAWRAATSKFLPAAAFLLALAVSIFVFFKVPHFNDEISNLFQARILAHGVLAAPAPDHPEFFSYYDNLVDGLGWHSQYPPLWPWLLSLGLRVGASWMVGPLLGGLAVALLIRLGGKVSMDSGAWLGAALMATSPLFAVMSASALNHSLALACTVLTWIGLSAFFNLKDGSFQPGDKFLPTVWVGLGLAGLALTRPFNGLCLAAAYGAWLLIFAKPKSAWAGLWPLVLAGIGVFLCLLLSNHLSTGSWWELRHPAFAAANQIGFGAKVGTLSWGSRGFGLAKALKNSYFFLEDLSSRLGGWPFHLSLAMVILNFVLRRGGGALDGFLGLQVLGLMAGHFFYWGASELVYGPRYWYEALPALALLSVRGLQALSDWSFHRHGPAGRVAWTALAAGFFFFNLLLSLPRQAWAFHDYAGVDGRLSSVIRQIRTAPSLVFVRMDGAESFNEPFAHEDPWFNDYFFARDFDTADQKMIQENPGLKTLYWDGGALSSRRWKESLDTRTARVGREGLAALADGNAAAGRAIFLEGLKFNPSCPDFHEGLARADQQLGLSGEAGPEFQKAVSLDPQDPVWLRNQGLYWEAAGRKDQAQSAYEKALGLDPDDLGALNHLGQIYLEQGKVEQARPLLDRAFALESQS